MSRSEAHRVRIYLYASVLSGVSACAVFAVLQSVGMHHDAFSTWTSLFMYVITIVISSVE